MARSREGEPTMKRIIVAVAALLALSVFTPMQASAAPVSQQAVPAARGGRCTAYEGMLASNSPGWSVARMSQIMYRESRCRPGVRNRSGATGLLQIMPSNCRYIAAKLHESCSAGKLQNAGFNIRAAKVLWKYGHYGPWAL